MRTIGFLNASIFIILVLLFYFFPIEHKYAFDRTFVTVFTFLFAIFAGFFIARQGKRYSDMREKVSRFNAGITILYRFFSHLGKPTQKKVLKIIETNFVLAARHGNVWDYFFTHKVEFISAFHGVLEEINKRKNLKDVQRASIMRIFSTLENLQSTRKEIIALRLEQIPSFQWVVIVFLTAILIVTLSLISSQYILIASILKAAAINIILLIVVLLWKFDRLEFFEARFGQETAQDVLEIIAGLR